MSIEEDKALVQRFYAEIDAGNIDAMDELVAEDYVDDKSASISGLPAGREGLKQAFRIFWEATPGRHEIEDQIAQGDKVVGDPSDQAGSRAPARCGGACALCCALEVLLVCAGHVELLPQRQFGVLENARAHAGDGGHESARL